MMLRLSLLILLLKGSVLGAQTRIKSLALPEEIIFATVDRPGELYVTLKSGKIHKYDVDGNSTSVYNGNKTTLFDPRDGARLFAYYRQDQQYAYLSPSFEVTARHTIDSALVIEPWLACSSGDHGYWVIDGADRTLKRINGTTVAIDAEVTLKDIDNPAAITYMREYQGFLFLLHRDKGIIIHNSIGKQLRIVGVKNLSYFNFIGEELYFPLDGKKIQFFNLFTAETRDVQLQVAAQFVLLTDERLYSIRDKTIEFSTPLH